MHIGCAGCPGLVLFYTQQSLSTSCSHIVLVCAVKTGDSANVPRTKYKHKQTQSYTKALKFSRKLSGFQLVACCCSQFGITAKTSLCNHRRCAFRFYCTVHYSGGILHTEQILYYQCYDYIYSSHWCPYATLYIVHKSVWKILSLTLCRHNTYVCM